MIKLKQVASIARAIQPFVFDHFGGAVVTVGGLEISVETMASWTPSGGSAKFHDPTFELYAKTMPTEPNIIIPEAQRLTLTGFSYSDGTDWAMVDGTWRGKQHYLNRKRGNRDDYQIDFGRFTWTRAGDPFWQVVVVQGFNAAVFGKPDGDELRAFDFEALSRDAALVILDLHDAFDNPYAALVFAGANPLSDDAIESALSLLSVIGGRMVRIACIAQHGIDGAPVTRTCYKHDSYPKRAVPPFRLSYPRDGVRYLRQEFGSMLNALVASKSKPRIEIDVAITHLLADHAFIDTEIRDITLALDTLVESEAFKSCDVAPFLPKAQLEACAKPLLDGLSKVLGPNALDRARSIIHSLNDGSRSVRRDAFWRRVGFSLTPDERHALLHRHTMSHRGFLFSASGESDDGLQYLYHDVATLRTLVTRCVFALLGWRHPLQNHGTLFDEPMPTRSDEAASEH